MREHLFKAKRIDNGEWVEGRLLSNDVIVPCGQDFYISAGIIESYLRGYEVHPETVCEYTGLEDKNGKKIFEGDMVKCTIIYSAYNDIGYITKKTMMVVEFTEGIFQPFQSTLKTDYEVIGNIFDNKELLIHKENN